jgi:hypothetical protein
MKRRRAVSLVEVVMTLAVFGLVGTLATKSFLFLQHTQQSVRGRFEPRQQVRALMLCLQEAILSSMYIRQGFAGNCLGHTFDTPYLTGSPPRPEGNDLLVLAPSETANSFKATAIFCRPRQPQDERNPGAFEVVVHSIPSTPVGVGEAALVPGLLTGGAARVFDCYVAPDAVTPSRPAFLFRMEPGGLGVQLRLSIRYTASDGTLSRDAYGCGFSLRNY